MINLKNIFAKKEDISNQLTANLKAFESDVTDGGERATPEMANWGFYAHLSLYSLAIPYVKRKRFLDAGCGTGYGTYYLCKNGAKFGTGIDLSEKAIEFCKENYTLKKSTYKQMNLRELEFSPKEKFNVIISSNVLEHIPLIDVFFEKAINYMTSDGVFILAVPPIITKGMLEENQKNPYHINNLTPKNWYAKLNRYFCEVQGYRHWVNPEWEDETGFPKDIMLPPEETVIREADFSFTSMDIDELNVTSDNITVVMIAKNPRKEILPSSDEESELPEEW